MYVYFRSPRQGAVQDMRVLSVRIPHRRRLRALLRGHDDATSTPATSPQALDGRDAGTGRTRRRREPAQPCCAGLRGHSAKERRYCNIPVNQQRFNFFRDYFSIFRRK